MLTYYKDDDENVLKYFYKYMENVPEDKRYKYDENGEIDNDRRTYYQDAEIKIKK